MSSSSRSFWNSSYQPTKLDQIGDFEKLVDDL